MNQSTSQPLSGLESLAFSIKTFRRKHGVSLNQLSKLSGISRRTLTRVEAGFYSSHGPALPVPPVPSVAEGSVVEGSVVEGPRVTGHEPRHLSPRVAYRLAQLLLPPDRFQQMLQRGTEPPFPFNLLPDPYPLFLFHHSPPAIRRQFEQEFAPDYSGAFFRLILMPERNLAQRLRAFRLQHGLTLKDTAYLLDLSLSHLHALETAQRQPSPRTRFKLLRLLTLPINAKTPRPAGPLSTSGHSFTCPEWNRGSPAEQQYPLPQGKAMATSSPGRVGKHNASPRTHHPQPRPSPTHRARPTPRVAGRRARVADQPRLNALKALLSIPPPEPIELTDDSDRLHRLRYLWLTSTDSTRLGISQPHLIRLLRGDRRPSRSLRRRLELLTAPLP